MKTDRGIILKILYITIFLTATGLGTITFLLPVYIEMLGGNYVDMGIIGAVGNLAYTVMTIISGYILDRFERVRFYLVNMIFSSIVSFLFIFAKNINHLIMLRTLLGIVSASFWVSASTLTADISPLKNLTHSMGRYNLAWIVGFTFGPYIGGIISNAFGFKIFFLSLSVTILISSLIVLTQIHPRIVLRPFEKFRKTNYKSIKSILFAYMTLLPFTMILGIYMAIMPGQMSLEGLSASNIGFLLTITNGIRGLNFMNVERYVKWGTRNSLFLSSSLLVTSMIMMRSANTMMDFSIPLFIYGIAGGIMTPVALDFITKRTTKENLGAAMGAHEGVYGIGMFFGPIIGGIIAEIYGPISLYSLLAIIATSIIPLTIIQTMKKN
jgi:MFS family permease